MKLRDARPYAGLLAVFVASFVLIHARSGASPALWLDTLNDEREVRLCVVQGSCSLLGQSASIDGLFLAGGWLHFRALLFSLGFGLNGVHLFVQVCDALGVVALVVAGDRLAAPPTGALAALILMGVIGTAGATPEAVYNLSTMAFLGAAMLVMCVSAVRRPGYSAAVLSGLLAAVMTDSHVSAAPLGITAVLVAFLAGEKRFQRATVAAASFVIATFAIAPLEVLADFDFVRHPGSHRLAPKAPPISEVVSALSSDMIAVCALVGIVAWLVAILLRRSGFRRELDVVVATTGPMLAAFVFALAHGVADSGGRYLAQTKPAAAVSVALPLVALGRWGLSRWVRAGASVPTLADASPWALAFVLLLLVRRPKAPGSGRLPLFSMNDLEAITHVLRDERAWSLQRAMRDVRTTESGAMLSALSEYETGWPDSPEADGRDEERTSAYVLKVDAAALPATIPRSWTILEKSDRAATLVVFTPSRLDWGRAGICGQALGGAPLCRAQADRGNVASIAGATARLVMQAPRLPGATGFVFMPRIPGQCGGVIKELDGGRSGVSPDGRHAVLRQGAGTLTLAWDLHSTACPEYYGPLAAPFFLEGAGDAALSLQPLLEWYER